MFGKLSAFINYMKIWDVYLVKRFPSNRMSLWGVGLSYMIIYFTFQRMVLIGKEYSLKRSRSINRSYIKNQLTRC
jgi:hypothetical protein